MSACVGTPVHHLCHDWRAVYWLVLGVGGVVVMWWRWQLKVSMQPVTGWQTTGKIGHLYKTGMDMTNEAVCESVCVYACVSGWFRRCLVEWVGSFRLNDLYLFFLLWWKRCQSSDLSVKWYTSALLLNKYEICKQRSFLIQLRSSEATSICLCILAFDDYLKI